MAGHYDNDGRFAYGRLLYEYQSKCPTQDHLLHPLACVDAQAFQGMPLAQQREYFNTVLLQMGSFLYSDQWIRDKIKDPDQYDQYWPLLYYPYSKFKNAAYLENKILQMGLDDDQAWVIRNNESKFVQERAMILNMPNFGAFQGNQFAGPPDAVMFDLPTTFRSQDWQVDVGWHLAVMPPHDSPLLQEFCKDYPDLCPSSDGPTCNNNQLNCPGQHVNPGFTGNPFWMPQDRQSYITQVLMQQPWNPNDVTASYPHSNQTVSDPTYKGHLPDLQVAYNQSNAPVAPWRNGGAGKTYVDPCDASGLLEAYAPLILAGLAVVPSASIYGIEDFPAVLGIGSWVAGGYLIGKAIYGEKAYDAYIYNDYKEIYLATGVFCAGNLAAISMQLAEDGTIQGPPMAIAALAAAIGWFVVATPVGDKLKPIVVGLDKITSPLAWVDDMLTKWLWNGCIKESFASPGDCLCADAMKVQGGKEGLIDDWLHYYLDTTDQQYLLRQACLRGRMARGPWRSTDSTNPNLIGSCDLGSQIMTNPMACLSSASWMYKDPWIPSQKRSGDLEFEMWNEIADCFDDKNPSALPPATDQDRHCQTQYGEYFRWDAAAGNCKNFLAPVATDVEPDARGPGQFDFVGLLKTGTPSPPEQQGSGCSIQ